MKIPGNRLKAFKWCKSLVLEMYLKFHIFNCNRLNTKFEEKHVGRSPQEILTPPTYRNVLISLQGTIWRQNEIVPRYGKFFSFYARLYVIIRYFSSYKLQFNVNFNHKRFTKRQWRKSWGGATAPPPHHLHEKWPKRGLKTGFAPPSPFVFLMK